jgi:predicted acyltransferase
MIFLLSGIALLLVLIERIWPGNELPSSKAWWLRIFVINTVQVGILILAGHTWDRWFQKASLFHPVL